MGARAWRLGAAVVSSAAALACLPAGADASTIDVDTTADTTSEDDHCSLREAVDASNTNAAVKPGGAGPDCPAGSPGATDTIVLGAGTYTLTGPNEDSNASGDLDINADGPGPVAISGAGEGQTTIGSDGADRVIELLDGTLDIGDLKITGGVAPTFGGGVFADGNPAAGHLSLTDVTVAGNSAPGSVLGRGGGIAVSEGPGSELDLTRATIDGNAAGNGGGGGIAAYGDVTITNSQISSNDAASTVSADGAGLALGSGTATISGSTIEDNHAGNPPDPQGGQGGGIYFTGTSASDQLTIEDSAISQNTTRSSGGGLTVSGSDVSVDLIDTTVTGNQARSGAGLNAINGSSLGLLRTRVVGNQASSDFDTPGGGILVGDIGTGASLEVVDSVVSANSVEGTSGGVKAYGGGIDVTQSSEMRIVGTEIAGNTATGDPGYGGGIAQAGSSTGVVLNSTVNGNGAGGTGSTGGGVMVFVNGGDARPDQRQRRRQLRRGGQRARAVVDRDDQPRQQCARPADGRVQPRRDHVRGRQRQQRGERFLPARRDGRSHGDRPRFRVLRRPRWTDGRSERFEAERALSLRSLPRARRMTTWRSPIASMSSRLR